MSDVGGMPHPDRVERQIFCEWQIEKSKLIFEKMEDFAEFVEALAKADIDKNDIKEILISLNKVMIS
jgi:hypothetical protein